MHKIFLACMNVCMCCISFVFVCICLKLDAVRLLCNVVLVVVVVVHIQNKYWSRNRCDYQAANFTAFGHWFYVFCDCRCSRRHWRNSPLSLSCLWNNGQHSLILLFFSTLYERYWLWTILFFIMHVFYGLSFFDVPLNDLNTAKEDWDECINAQHFEHINDKIILLLFVLTMYTSQLLELSTKLTNQTVYIFGELTRFIFFSIHQFDLILENVFFLFLAQHFMQMNIVLCIRIRI